MSMPLFEQRPKRGSGLGKHIFVIFLIVETRDKYNTRLVWLKRCLLP